MTVFLGAYPPNAKVHFKWNSTGQLGQSSAAASGTPVRVFKGISDIPRSGTGINDIRDFSGMIGLNHVSIDLSDNSDPGFYEAGYAYAVRSPGLIIDSISTMATLAVFTIANPSSGPPEPPVDDELVKNGTFDSSAFWNLSPSAAVGGGMLICDGVAIGRASQDNFTITTGDYTYAFDVIWTDGDAPVTITVGLTSLVVPGSTVAGHYTGTIACLAADPSFSISVPAGTGAQLDNFSLKRVAAPAGVPMSRIQLGM